MAEIQPLWGEWRYFWFCPYENHLVESSMLFVPAFTVSGGESRICPGLSLDIGECCFFEKLAFPELKRS